MIDCCEVVEVVVVMVDRLLLLYGLECSSQELGRFERVFVFKMNSVIKLTS